MPSVFYAAFSILLTFQVFLPRKGYSAIWRTVSGTCLILWAASIASAIPTLPAAVPQSVSIMFLLCKSVIWGQ